jgi:multidrug efflux pump subunit AcrA (membrane-fusion protein)
MCPAAGASAAYNSAASSYNAARSGYQSAVSGLSTAETTLDTLRKTLNSGNLQRSIQNAQIGLTAAQQKLAETRAGAKVSELEAARRSADSARASLTAAQARYDDLFDPPAPDVLLPLQNAIDQAQADVETAKKNLAAATIIAPFDGQISQVTGEVGTQVSATTAVFILLNPNVIRIDANVDQADVSNIKAGQTANVTFDALPGRSYQAQVAALGLTPTITQGVVTYVVTLSVDTARLAQGTPVPAPGMTGSIQVTTTRTDNALVVPSRAVRRSGRTATVTVRTGSGTEQRQVTTGVTNGTLIQIVTGLQDGDEVLVSAPSTTSTTAPQGGQQQFFFGPGGGPIR